MFPSEKTFCSLYFRFVSPGSLGPSINIQLITDIKWIILNDQKLKSYFLSHKIVISSLV